jgi:hypothetical protein
MTSDTTERQQYELRTLHSYLLTIVPSTPLPPDNLLLSPNSIAIQSAIAGIENQLVKLERDEKLRRKFALNEKGGSGSNPSSSSSTKANCSTTMEKENDEEEDMDDEYVKMTKEDAAAATMTMMSTTAAAAAAAAAATKSTNDDDDAKMDDDWEETDRRIVDLRGGQAVGQEGGQMELTITDFDDQYFRYLASTTIAKIASSKINVGTPLGALALALHIALLIKRGARSGVGGGNGGNELRCTGVPPLEDGNGGFAPPVRELPPGVLVPNS